jgi:putative thioredoxin
VLEKKLEEGKNFKLLKINIDNNQELTETLSISSIPAVFLIYKGNVVDSFVGLPDQKKLDTFFDSVNLLRGLANDEKIVRALLTGADEFMNKKQYDRAENMFNEALSHGKWKNKYSHIVRLGLALCSFNKGDYTQAEKLLKEIKNLYKNQINSDPILTKKLALLELKLIFRNNPELAKKQTGNIYKEIENNPKDLQWRYQLAVLQFENSQYEESINTLLEMMKMDRNWSNKAAQQFLIHIFNYLGSNNKLTIDGRSKLAKILY